MQDLVTGQYVHILLYCVNFMDNKPAIVKQIENSLEIIKPVIYRMPVDLIFVISIFHATSEKLPEPFIHNYNK